MYDANQAVIPNATVKLTNRATGLSRQLTTNEGVQRAAAIWLGAGAAPNPFNGASLTLNADDFVNPRSFQSGLGFDTELFSNFIAGVQLNYVNTVHLLRNRNYNLGIPVINPADQSQRPSFTACSGWACGPSTSSRCAKARPAACTAPSRSRRSTGPRSCNFGLLHAGSELLRCRFRARAGGFEYANSFNLRDEYNFSNQDIRHQFTANAVYQLPWGLEIAGISRAISGLPITPRTGADVNGDGNNNDRPYSGPGKPLLRNSFRNRSIARTDLRVMKSVKFGETRRLQFPAEFFNLFNRDNVVIGTNNFVYGAGFQPNGSAAAINTQFMRVFQADGSYDPNNQQIGNPLQMQLGVRFFF